MKELYRVIRTEGGVDVELSEYLISLPHDKRIAILKSHLESLKEDLKKKRQANRGKLRFHIEIAERLISEMQKEA